MTAINVEGGAKKSVLIAGNGNTVVLGGLIRPLPPLFSDESLFVGRLSEIERLRQALLDSPQGAEERHASVVGIRGLGGIGKTALVRHFAVSHQQHFAGGILWGNLGSNQDMGERGADLNPFEVLREELLRWEAEMGAAGSTDRPWKVVLSSVRSLLTERQARLGSCLLILDNIDNADVLGLLLEQLAFCAILLTTRQENLVTERRMGRIDLSGLARQDSHFYLETTLAIGPERLAKGFDPILNYIEDHPLGLKLLVGLLRDDPENGESQLLARLTTEPRTRSCGAGLTHIPASLQDCFRVSVQRLPRTRPRPLQSLLISLASQSSVSFSVEAADYVSGFCRLKQTLQSLSELKMLGLVEEERGRFRIHRLLRDYLGVYHGFDGFGRLPAGMAATSAAWWIIRLCPSVSAGQRVYDLRQDYYFYLYAQKNRDDPVAFRQERDGLLLSVHRCAERGMLDSLWLRIQVLSTFLAGANLSKLKLGGLRLDDARLDEISLRDAHLSGGPPRSWRQIRKLAQLIVSMLLVSTVVILAMMGINSSEKPGEIRLSLTLVAAGLWIFGLILIGVIGAFHATRRPDALLEIFPDWVGELIRIPFWSITLAILGSLGSLIIALFIFITDFTAKPAKSSWIDAWSAHLNDIYGFLMMTDWVHRILLTGAVGGAVLGLFAGLQGLLVRSCQRFGIGGLGFKCLAALGVTVSSGIVLGWKIGAALGVAICLFAAPGRLSLFEAARIRHGRWTRSYLRRTSLQRADLRGTDLRWARIQGANLTQADLSGANLQHARLDRAVLAQANFLGANLSHASLCHADLRGANLCGVDLSHSDLTGASYAAALSDQQTRWPTASAAKDKYQGVWVRWLLFGMSLLIPGFAHMLCRRIPQGAAWLLTTALGYFCFIIPGGIIHCICLVMTINLLWGSNNHEERLFQHKNKIQFSVLMIIIGCFVPGLAHLLSRKFLKAFLWLTFTLLGYVLFIIPGIILHIICIISVARLYEETLRMISPSENRNNSKRASYLVILSLIVPGLLHLYRRQFSAGLAWLFLTVAGYLCLIVPGLFLHVLCIVRAAEILTHNPCPYCDELVSLGEAECTHCHEVFPSTQGLA